MTDIPGNSSTTATVTVGSTTSGTLETTGDHDWYRITLSAGQAITVTINGVTLEDPYLYIRDSAGNLLYQNDDISAGVIRDSKLSFTAGYTGTYYIDVGAFNDAYTGDYKVVVQAYNPPPLATYDQIANQLTSGYWNGDTHHFDVTQGGTITVNISTLTAAEKVLARAALAEWTDIIGVKFQEVSTGGQIVFDNSEDSSNPGPIAATDANWSFGIISSAHVQISSSWVNTYGTSLNSYSFQTYIHEIGHALGLGHAGNYNGDATYPYDASFQNDAWSTSIMSYFSQHDNSYFAAQGFSEDYAVTPMLADILAMQQLYGLSTTTRTGDTTYGYNSNAGSIYNASLYPNVAYTIFDNGGTDTLDFSGSSYNQVLNLNPETFSNVNGNTGNITIARGVVIENAIGGSGNDTIIGNASNNVLNGGAGDDTVSYETATAGVTIDLGITTAQNTVGAGTDTLSGFEHLTGSAFADVLIGGASTISLTGGAGNDVIKAGGAISPSLGMYGGDGDDIFVLGSGETWVDGGTGFDTVDCSSLTAGITLITSGHAGSGVDTLNNIEKIIGSNYADNLYAWNPGDVLIGGAGDDTLTSNGGTSALAGGTGNDTYVVWSGTDQITENAGEGTDTIVASRDFALPANIENLTLHESITSDPYAGAAITGNQPENWNGTGNDLANVMTGNAGANVLSGLGGNDTLTGGAGDDTLIGGLGADALDGGDGNDRVVYDPVDDPAKVAGGAGTDTLVVQDLAAPMGFNLVAQGFELAEVTQTDTGANAWSSIVKLYDSGWALTKQTTANDDGSRVVVDLDPHNLVNTSQVWSSYDALSRLSSVDQIFDNGTRTFINLDEAGTQSWMQDWFAYDAQARLDSEDVHYDNGSRTFINLDQDGSKSWSQDWFAYDAQGRLDSEDVHYDNGTRTFINLDQDGSKSWSQDWFSYDAQGRLVSEDRLFDDGTHTFIRIDAAGSESWSQAWFTYDAQGRLDTQDVINDDGSRTFTNYDQAGTEPFSLTATLYHPDGTAYEQVTTWDDGHTTYTLI